MLFVTTSGHRSPKVLIISAVCGRAPPCDSAPKPPSPPPAAPPTSHDSLSVTKTRACSAGGGGTGGVAADCEIASGKGKQKATITNTEMRFDMLFIPSGNTRISARLRGEGVGK